jgi:acetyl esterase/lipase
VVSPEYRKGPENKFPAAHEDTFAAYKWVVQNAGQLKGNDRKIAVLGESAGGNMAAVIANRARSEGVKPPKAQVLIYPVASDDLNSPSYQRNTDAKPLNRAMMKWFFDKYLNTPAEMSRPWIALVKADVKGVAPATIITAEIDPLHSDGEMYAKHLRDSGVDVVQKTYKGVTHEFFGMASVLPEAKEAQALAADRLKAAFAE